MTWYTNTDKQELDYSKPICGESGGNTYILLPNMHDNSYNLRGYDWFNPKNGEWNSCKNYNSVGDALDHSTYTNIRNCEMQLCEV